VLIRDFDLYILLRSGAMSPGIYSTAAVISWE
jgi:hypothetical protein